MPESRIQLGVIGRPHGVRGLVRVTSHTANPADLTAYGPLSDGGKRQFVLRWKAEGIAEVSEIINGASVKVADRTAAEKLTNTRLFIDRAALPAPEEEDEYYLSDLIGLMAVDAHGRAIGSIAVVHDYGAGASLEIERPGAAPLILPFTRACVPVVDIPAGRVAVVPPDEIVAELVSAESETAA
ncbi:MAG: ribosome maturation factor RimM [Rhodopila sp.]